MAEWQDVYKNIQPADPLKQIGAVYGLAQAAQGLELSKQAERIRQFELDKAQADDLRSSVGTLANVPGVTRAEVLATMAQRARQMGIHPRVYHEAAEPFRDPSIAGDRLQKALTIQGVGAAGPASLTQRQDVVDQSTGARTSIPAPAAFAKPTGAGQPTALAAAQQQTGGRAGELVTKARGDSIQYARQAFPLEQAITSLERLGTTGTGPGTDTINQIKSFALSMGLPGVDANKIVDYDSAKKYLTDFVNQTGNSGTNEKLQAAFAGNPSVHISNEAAVKVSKAALALRRMEEARTQAWEKSGLSDDEYPKFASKWNREHDARVFGFDMMTPTQRKNVLKNMTQAQRDLFMLDVDQASQTGILRPPRTLPPSDK